MEPEIMVVAIVAIVMTAGIINRAIKARHQGPGSAALDDIHDRLERLERLEERVKVLEKIVTDKKHKLADEIDNL